MCLMIIARLKLSSDCHGSAPGKNAPTLAIKLLKVTYKGQGQRSRMEVMFELSPSCRNERDKDGHPEFAS